VGFQPNDPGDRRKMVREFKSRRPHHNILGPRVILISGSASRDTPTELSAQNSAVDTGGICRRLFILSEVLTVLHVRSRHHFASILQAKAEPGPSHLGFDRHGCALGLARVHLTRRSDRPTRLGHIGDCWRRDPLRCHLGVPRLQVPTETREAADAGITGPGLLSRERRCRWDPPSKSIEKHSTLLCARISHIFLEESIGW